MCRFPRSWGMQWQCKPKRKQNVIVPCTTVDSMQVGGIAGVTTLSMGFAGSAQTNAKAKKTEKNATANRPDAVRVRRGRRKGGRDHRSHYVRAPAA